MKGLLIKDLKLLINQGRTMLLMLIIVSLFLSLTDTGNPSFIVGYITIVFSFFTTSTVSYDEFENGYLFLLTLPVTRRKFVNEKYIFGFIITITAWLFGMIVSAVLMLAEGTFTDTAEWLLSSAVLIMVAWMFTGLMLPLRLKFNAEKARYANLIVMGAVFVILFAGSKLIKYIPSSVTNSLRAFYQTFGDHGIFLVTVGITAAALIISYVCSQHIMAKKEF